MNATQANHLARTLSLVSDGGQVAQHPASPGAACCLGVTLRSLLAALRCMHLLGDAHLRQCISTPSSHWLSSPSSSDATALKAMLAAPLRHRAAPARRSPASPLFASSLTPLVLSTPLK